MRGRWAWAAILAIAVAACGGSADPAGGGSGPGQEPVASAGAGEPGSGGSGGSGSGDAPVTVTVGGTTHGYDVGTCDVAGAGDLYADAATSAMSFQSVNVRISDEAGAALRAIVPLAEDTPPLQLFAGDPRPDTSWDVSVEGTTAVIEARMFDESPAAGEDPFHDVTITIRCVERGFGGMAPPTVEPEAPPAAEEPAPTALGEAAITLDLGGTVSTYTYPGCPLQELAIALAVADESLNQLYVTFGELRYVAADGTTWSAEGVEFTGSPTQGSWSGTLTSPAAGDRPATITIACG